MERLHRQCEQRQSEVKRDAIVRQMPPPRRKGMNLVRLAAIVLTLAQIFILGVAPQARALDNKAPYTSMAPLDQYLMDRNAEIVLARTAAPESISRDAEVLVLGRHGYETAVKGKNGWVCIVERSWMAPFDDPEFLNPDQRLPLCLNPPAVRTHLPLTLKTTELAMAGLSKTQMFDSIKAAYDKKELPLPEAGAMCYMTSKQQYFSRKVGNADPHLMFWFPRTDDMFWGAGLPGSPVYVHQYSPEPITEFVISVSKWSDGTPAPLDAQ
jgi:hypothetical protein